EGRHHDAVPRRRALRVLAAGAAARDGGAGPRGGARRGPRARRRRPRRLRRSERVDPVPRAAAREGVALVSSDRGGRGGRGYAITLPDGRPVVADASVSAERVSVTIDGEAFSFAAGELAGGLARLDGRQLLACDARFQAACDLRELPRHAGSRGGAA